MTEPEGDRPERAGASASTAAAPPASVPQQYEPREREQPSGAEPGTSVVAPAAPGAPGDSILAAAARQSWPAVLAGGLGLIALGIMLLVWPRESLTVMAILVGAALLVSGLVKLWEGFTASNTFGGMRAAYVVIGLLAVLAGLYFLRHHALSLFLVAFLAGVYFIAHGISDIGIALSTRVHGRGLRAVLGIFSLAAGLIMLVWPAITLVLLLTIAGAWLIFYGLMLAILAFELRTAGHAASVRRARPGELAGSAP